MRQRALFFVAFLMAAVAIAQDMPTPAEVANFESTPSYDETIAFLKKVEAKLPEMKLTFYGTSAQGRPMPLVIVSKDKAFTPAEAARTGKPVVMIQNGIHAGEIDGKDA